MIDNRRDNERPTTNFHADYVDVVQYWSQVSEKYAGGDGLVTALYNGWQIDGTIIKEEKSYTGMRRHVVYHVPLRRGDEEMVMPVLHNPYVNRVIMNSGADIVKATEAEQ